LAGEELEERRPTFACVSDSAPRHTQGEEPEVQDVLKRYEDLKKSWTSATEEISGLVSRSKPWKELTDRFDELYSAVERVGGLVDADERTSEELDEAEGGGLSDLIVNFKVGYRGTGARKHLGLGENPHGLYRIGKAFRTGRTINPDISGRGGVEGK
jgi:hypothetical protein